MLHPHPNPPSPTLTTLPSKIDPLGYGRVAIVTGCASGIGLAVTQLLLAHQFRVCGLDAAAFFDYALLQAEADHGRFHFHCGDLGREGVCEEGVRICRAVFGDRVDVLVNVAGVMDDFSSADGVSDEVWERVMAVNLTAPVKMMRAVLPGMRERRDGVVVNVASTAAASGAVAGVAYTASKHGLVGATKNVAWRFRNDGIRCNAVLPGAIDSAIGKTIASGHNKLWDSPDQAGPAQSSSSSQEAAPSPGESAPLPGAPAPVAPGRSITALEVARTIVFLISDQARTISGVCLPVDRACGVA
ncbi:hypothetical protein C8A05DRAFT_37636 [Staphylotrichum tortipilum]|uniref:3-oxoacyl-[acyl-carrier-protein] reductase n=1 Tax=Staphylotrichum tortipilum TaxID=2831512 RepID=A0AAN6RPM0_9PEZI|nr:hypothetical protein C8A05DRAFT_37636 [Staphylotrichum longicolle]